MSGRCLIGLILVCTLLAGMAAGQRSGLGALQTKDFPDKMTLLLPAGWTVDDYQCSGIVAHSHSDPYRAVLFMNALHQNLDMLPRGTTPEAYVTDYLARDLSLGGDQVSDVTILSYEDADLSSLTAFGAVQVKAMRCSMNINGKAILASLTVGTYDVQLGTSVAYLWGIYSPADQFDLDAPILKRVFDSIRYDKSFTDECNQILKDRAPAAQ